MVATSDSTTTEVVITPDMVTGFNPDSVGVQQVTITFEVDGVPYTRTFDVTVKEPEIVVAQVVKISAMPKKTTYKKGEQLDVTDGKLTVIYSDGTTQDVDLKADMVNGFNADKVGTQKLTVTLKVEEVSLTATFDVTIEDDGTVIEVNYDEAVVTPETIWDDADFSDDNGGGNNNGNFSFNEWYTYGSMSNPYFESNDGSVSIYVPEGGNNWDLAFCNIFHNVDGQSVGNKFKLSFDVKWIGESSAESAQFHIFSGLNYYTNDEGYTVFVHKDDYQFNATENTEILFVGDFLANMDSLYTATNEWTRIEWGGTIGEKGADYIGVQISLPDLDGNNIGTFRFRNMEVQFGEDNVLSFYETAGIENINNIVYKIINNEATIINNTWPDDETNLTIPSTVTIDGVQYNVTSIGEYAFNGLWELVSVTIPNSVESIGEGAFIDCENLSAVVIPESVKSIGVDAFYYVPCIVYSGSATGSPWGANSVGALNHQNARNA